MKTKSKIIVLVISIMLLICILNINSVKATDITSEDLQNVLDAIPDKIETNLKEVECQKANEIIKEEINEVLKEKEIDTTGINLNVYASPIYMGIDSFYTVNIYLEISENVNINKSKDIEITYSNTDKYNSNDELSVKNLKLEDPEYYVVDYEKLFTEDRGEKILDSIELYYDEQCDDNTIKFITDSGAYGGGPLETGFHSIKIAIFKNDVLYDIRTLSAKNAVAQITIPATVNNIEEDSIDYAISVLKTKMELEGHTGIITITKGDEYDDGILVEDGYTVKEDGNIMGTILLKKEVKDIAKEDSSTGIKLDCNTQVIPSDVELIVEKIEEGKEYDVVAKSLSTKVEKFIAYDISLISKNVKVQPSGKVKISLPIPEGYDTNKILVFRVEENGDKTEYETTVENKYVTFETDHFSNYVLAQESSIEIDTTIQDKPSNDKNEENEIDITDKNESDTADKNEENKVDTSDKNKDEVTNSDKTPNVNNKLDETPKTGKQNKINYIFLSMCLISLIGIILIKKCNR